MTDKAVTDAISRAYGLLVAWAESRMEVSRPEKIAWDELKKACASEAVEALHDAGYVVSPMGGHFPTEVSLLGGPNPYPNRVRVRLEVRPVYLGAEQTLDLRMWEDANFREHHLPRVMAKSLLAHLEGRLIEDISLGIATRVAEKVNA